MVIAWASPGHTGGFYVPEVGGRATGMGAAVVADAADPSAVFHNPAQLAETTGTTVELAADLVLPRISFFRRPVTDPNTGANLRFAEVSNTNHAIAIPFLGASHRLTDRLALGLAVYTPFGATLEFPTDGAQRQIVTRIALRTITASPALAVNLPSGFSAGVALNLVYADLALEQRNAIPYVTGDPEQYPDPDPGLEGMTRLSAKDPFSVGATLGASWHSASGQVRVGASVQTPVTLRLEGDAHVENPGISALYDANNQELQPAGAREDQIAIHMRLPLIARLGVAVRPVPHWQIEADVNWQRWSAMKRLVIDFQHEYELIPTPGAYLYDVTVENDWRDTITARLGVEARPFAAPVALRGGVVWDQTPIDDRHFSLLTPDSNKLGVSAGATWSHAFGASHLDLEVGALHLFVAERSVAPAANGAPGSDGTILNKPAPSFFHGVTRAGFDVFSLAVIWRH